MRKITLALLMAISLPAAAWECKANDAWTGKDKNLHFVGGAAVGSAGTLYFKDPHKGFLLGTAAGLFIEVRDARGAGVCSFQDFAVTVAGAAAGAYGTAWFIAPRKGGVVLGYVGTFN